MASFNVWGSIGKAFWLYKSGKIRECTIVIICLSHRFLRILWVDRKFEWFYVALIDDAAELVIVSEIQMEIKIWQLQRQLACIL